MNEIDGILHFWFGTCTNDPLESASRGKLWYGGDSADDEIRSQFSTLLSRAESGALKHWQNKPSGSLALIILLDQFSRNIYRGTAAAFRNDAKALLIAETAIAETQDEQLSLIERAFLYHPFEHAETITAQEQSLALFASLLQLSKAPAMAAWHTQMYSFAQYAKKHFDIIQAFGRYPHRNAVMGRANTESEKDYLAQGGSRFGQ